MANKLTLKRSAVPGKVPTTTDLDLGEIAINTYDGKAYMKKNVSGVESIVLLVGAGSGDVVGPASSADNAIARFDQTSGKIIQNSSATVDDSGNINALTMQSSGTGANKMPVGTSAQRPGTPSAGMYRMNSTTGYPEWYDAAGGSWVSFNAYPTYSIEYLIVGGGGGGGAYGSGGGGGGGGGAGGMITGTLSVEVATNYPVTVGAGGSGGYAVNGSNGSSSSFSSTASVGGGGGDRWNNNGNSGGSGGGGSYGGVGGSGTSGQGNNGGNGADWSGGGGGGKSAAGAAGTYHASGGNGGNGASSSISGAAVTYAGGGGGGTYTSSSGTGGTGGTGGGGNGGKGSATPGNGSANTGGGGGGSGDPTGGNGGSGIVIIRYAGSQRGTGGTVTSSGGYTIHTFTSSGTFTA